MLKSESSTGSTTAVAGHVNKFGIVGWVDVVTRYLDDRRGAFAQTFRGRHGASFIPKEENDRADEKRDADQHSDKGPPDPAQNGLVRDLGDYISH
jgi:hypothetical protein